MRIFSHKNKLPAVNLQALFFIILVLLAPILAMGAFFIFPSASSKAMDTKISSKSLEAGEIYPGGDATAKNTTLNRNAFSHSSGNMPFTKELNFKIGNGLFRKLWVSAPASTKSSDGLGPLFNARSCQRCHLKDGRGHTPTANWPKDNQVSMFLRLSIPPQTDEHKQWLTSGKVNIIAEPTYGTQLQDLAIQGHWGEGKMHIEYKEKQVTLHGGEIVKLRMPHYTITNLRYGTLHPETMISPRLTPQMIGLGLLEAIPREDILSLEDIEDNNQDGISGKANKVWSIKDKKIRLGRFGWKAGNPTVRQQSAGAFAGDLGLSTSLVSKASGDCTKNQKFCLDAPNGNSPKYGSEVSDQMLDFVTFYAQNLAVPKRRNARDRLVLQGKFLFYKIGCNQCHRPHYVTGKSPGNPHLENQKIWPYTDLLLHDMGEELADNRPEALANGREWRTPPLWGIGLTKTVNGHEQMLHDGRARSIKEAIVWHGGEGQKARDLFIGLSKSDREALIAFVKSL